MMADQYEYQAVLQALRDAIDSGRYRPGAELPSERRLAARLRVGRDTVRRAVTVLVYAGVLERQGAFKPARVAKAPVRSPVLAPIGARVTARMPTPSEASELGLDTRPGVPVLVVALPGRPEQVFAANTTALIIAWPVDDPRRREVDHGSSVSAEPVAASVSSSTSRVFES